MELAADSDRSAPVSQGRLTDIAIGVVIGRTSEFFDFFVFAIAAVLVFPQFIFSFATQLDGTLFAFLVLALGFVARPVGSFVFTAMDRRWGRGVKLTASLFLLGMSTVAISFLPSFESEGWLTVASLCLFRMGQGAALGGAYDGMSSLLAMNAPEDRKARYATLPQIGAPIGLILASALFVFLRMSLTDDEFLNYGWRYPFFVAFAINVVALFARLRLAVSEEFDALYAKAELRPRINPRLLLDEASNLIAGSFVPLATLALMHMVTVFPLAWIHLNAPENVVAFLWIEIFGGAIGLGGIIASGFLADRIGRRSLLRNCAIAIAVYAVISPVLLGLGLSGQALYVFIGFALLGLSFGQSSGVVAAGFAMENRYTASNLTSDLSWMFGAGFAPVVALFLAERFGLWSAGVYLLSGALCTLAALTLFRRNMRQRQAEDRSWR